MARKKSSKNSKAAGNQAVAATDTPATTVTTLDTAQDLLKPAPAEVSRIDPPEVPRTPSQQEQQEQEQEPEADILPVERAPPRRYEDDNDDEDHHHQSERARLIRTYSSESGTYSDGGPYSRSNLREAGVPESIQPTTWWEWAMRNGLHPRTWNRQTYIKAGLLVTLLTLIILSFTVFRIQDHIKDILKYVSIFRLEQENPL